MLARKPVKVVAIALANRMARTIWAFAMDLEPMATHGSLRRGDSYRSTVA
jgi:transposase